MTEADQCYGCIGRFHMLHRSTLVFLQMYHDEVVRFGHDITFHQYLFLTVAVTLSFPP